MAKLAKKTVEKMHAMYEAGKSPAEIAKAANIEYGTAYYHIKKWRKSDEQTSKLDVSTVEEAPRIPELPTMTIDFDSNIGQYKRGPNPSLLVVAATLIGFAIGVYVGMDTGAL